MNIYVCNKPLIFQTGSNIKLTDRAEYFKSIIADGKELIKTGEEDGELFVSELKDPKVYIAFKEGITKFLSVFYGCKALVSIPVNLFVNYPQAISFVYVFFGCRNLKEIPENLFANNPAVTTFEGTFYNCKSLKSIPEKLFAHNPNVTDFSEIFRGCSKLKRYQRNYFRTARRLLTSAEVFRTVRL